MSALKNYTLASDNANDFHKRVDVLLLQALQIITTDTLETMSSQTISLRKSYFSRVFQDQFKESQKVAKYLAKIWDEADINIDSTDVNSDDATIKTAIEDSINIFAEVNTIVEDQQIAKSWVAGEDVSVGWIRVYNGTSYRVVQAHITQAEWTPDLVPALFAVKHEVPQGETYPNWVQPTGAHDAYDIGDRVNHNGNDWESTAAANVWEPGVYGWTQV
jgi:hypothetical protein